MKALLVAMALAVTLILAGAVSALAQGRGPCLPHDDAVEKLKRQYNEHQVGIGIGQKGSSVIELFVAESGTWTILITRIDGMSCVAASGENWMSSPLEVDDSI